MKKNEEILATNETTKVTMNLTSESLKDVEAIKSLTGNTTTRTGAVANALRAYRIVLELQKEGKLILEKGGVKERIKFIG